MTWKYRDEVLIVMDEFLDLRENGEESLIDSIPKNVSNHIKYEFFEYWKRLYPKEDFGKNPFEEFKPSDGYV